MSPILKLKKDSEQKELLFELKYLMSLTTRERFEMMFKRTEELRKLMGKHESRKTFQVIKRTEGSGRPEEIENLILQSCKKLSYPRRRVSR